MPYYRKYIYSGDVVEIEECFSMRKVGDRISRGKNNNTTSEQQHERNYRNAMKNLSRIINANFTKKDIFITLTHKDNVPEPEAKKAFDRYLRRVRTYIKKHKLPDLKYVAVIEWEKTRTHHHIILNSISLDTAIELWDKGRVIVSKLDTEQDYTGLARYIVKEKKGKFDEKQKKRWSQSRNLAKPKVVRKEIIRGGKLINPPKGYKLLVREFYQSDVTGESQYVKAIRIDGIDIAQGKGKEVMTE